jgi:hypothetical protein
MYFRRVALLFGLVSVTLCPGCTKYLQIDISGVVKSAVDGKLLSGVKVYYSRYDDIDPLANGDKPDATTDASGRFSIVEKEAGSLPRTMRLIMVKEGFEKETIDIRPQKEPGTYDNPVIIVVAAQLRGPAVVEGR